MQTLVLYVHLEVDGFLTQILSESILVDCLEFRHDTFEKERPVEITLWDILIYN